MSEANKIVSGLRSLHGMSYNAEVHGLHYINLVEVNEMLVLVVHNRNAIVAPSQLMKFVSDTVALFVHAWNRGEFARAVVTKQPRFA